MIIISNAHTKEDLKQLQSLPLEAKIRLTKERIRAWYEAWWRYEIEDTKTGSIRYVAIDNRDYSAQPKMKDTEVIKSIRKGAVYVSFSGGKDSTVLKHIIDSMYDDVPSVFVNTGLEYPEIQKFVKEIKNGKYECFNSNIEILWPEMRFDEVIKRYGYPVISKEISETIYYARRSKENGSNSTRLKRLNGEWTDGNGNKSKFNCEKWKFMIDAPFEVHASCCNIMKEKPSKQYAKKNGLKQIVGTMACESRRREITWMKIGCNSFNDANAKSAPMSFWTEQDVLHYIKKFDVPYCSVYGEIEENINKNDELITTGCNRTGCIFCMFGCHLEKEPNRFQTLKKTHPRQYEYCINGGEMVDGKWQPNKEGLGLKMVLDYIGVKY